MAITTDVGDVRQIARFDCLSLSIGQPYPIGARTLVLVLSPLCSCTITIWCHTYVLAVPI
jgi:hypothetical protein